MKHEDELTEENFLFFAATVYYNPKGNDAQDFYEDLSKIKYIKKILARYTNTGKINERLLLNHIIVLANSFTVKGAVKMLEFRFNHYDWRIIKPALVRLNYIDVNKYNHIADDPIIIEILERI